MNREDELFIAKKTAERAGYKVEMPSLRQSFADRIAAAKQRAAANGIAKKAEERPSIADDLAQLALAARTAERAGLSIRKMTDVDVAKQVVQDAGMTVKKAEETPAPAPVVDDKPADDKPAEGAPAPEEKKIAPWLLRAGHFMPKAED